MKTRNALALAPLLLCFGLAAEAATITVADGEVAVAAGNGRCSLLEAVVNANATGSNRELSGGDCVAGSAGSDLIVLPPNAVYVLNAAWPTAVDAEVAGLPAITSVVTINGNGASLLRGTSDTGCASNRFRHVHVAPAGVLQLNALSLRWGCADGNGGAILNRGSLVLGEATLQRNRVQASGSGGALFVAAGASATVTASRFEGNEAGRSGGAIHNDGGLTVVGSVIDGNAVTVGAGGGLTSRGTVAMRESLVVGNSTAGAGGGLDVNGITANPALIDNSTIAHNRSSGGGAGLHTAFDQAIFPAPQIRVRSSTVAGNETVAGAAAGVLRIQGSPNSITLVNSLLVDNFFVDGSGNPFGTAMARDCENVGDVTGSRDTNSFCAASSLGTGQRLAIPLRPLADNGGAAASLAPSERLDVVDVGDSTLALAASATDQRGVGYPRVVGAAADVGAIELDAGDADGDGAVDDHEALAANAGDGNADGSADAGQQNVASRPVASGTGHVTVAVDALYTLFDVAVAPAAEDLPVDGGAPFGQVFFSVDGVIAGATVPVVLSFPQDERIGGFFVRDSAGNWANIPTTITHGDGRTQVAFSLTEGGAADRDSANTRIAVRAEERTPATPSPVRAVLNPANRAISLRWSPPASGGRPILGYVVERRIGALGGWHSLIGGCAAPTTIASAATTCTYTHPDGGQELYFRVSARNALGIGSAGPASAALFVPREPRVALGLFVQPQADRSVLSWSTPSPSDLLAPATGYSVDVTDGGPWTAAGGTCRASAIGGEPLTSCTVPLTNTATTQYRFRLRSRSAIGNSPDLLQSGTVNVSERPGAPVATAGHSQVALRWSPPSGSSNAYVFDYRIERSPDGTSNWGEAGGSCADAVVSAAPTCVDAGRSNGVAAFYRISARNAGGFSPVSVTASATPTAAAVGENDLLSLSVTDAAIAPAFDADTLAYTLSVPHSTSSITVRASSVDPAASLTAAGAALANGAETLPIALAVGDNVIEVVVNAARTYSLTVTRAAAPSPAAGFASISYNAEGTLVPIDANATFTSVVVPSERSSVTLDISADAPDAVIKLDGVTVGTGSVSGLTVPVQVGENLRYVRIESADGSDFRSMGLQFNRRHSSALSSLASAAGALSPAFDPTITSYSLSVGHPVSQVRFAITAADAAAAVTVGGRAASPDGLSPPVALSPGGNTVVIAVTGREGVTANYTVQVERAADTRLLALGSPAAMLSPAFDPETSGYTVNVASGVASLPLRAVLNDPLAGVSIGGQAASNVGVVEVPLAPGANSVPVVVTGTDNRTRTYTVTVNRGLPSFTVTPSAGSGGSLSPSAPQSVLQGVRASFLLSPDSGFRIAAVTGTCGGSLGGAVYTTNPVTASCTVEASFEPNTMVPGVPQNVFGSGLDGQILVEWQAPGSDGGSAITGYTARATPVPPAVGGTATCTAPGTGRGCSILGLVNGVAYAVSVVATNAEGSGNPGNAIQPATPVGSPGAPLNVSATLTGPSTALITWDAPASNGGSPIQSYAVVSTPAGANCFISGSPPLRACAVSGLVEGQAYTFAVTASNSLRSGTQGVSAPLFVGAGIDLTVLVTRVGLDAKRDRKAPAELRYLVQVTNNGSRLVDGIRLQVNAARGLAAITWTCAAPGGCAPGAGSDAVETQFGLGVGQSASIQITGRLADGESFVQLFAEASLPEGVVAVLRQDDRVVFTDNRGADGVLLDGFE